MVTSICPNPEDLRSFHLGMLDEDRELEVLDHLNSCPTCEDTVANLEGTEDSLVVAVRSSVDSESPVSDDRPSLQQALAEIEGLVDVQETSNHSDANSTPDITERIRDYELLGALGEGGMGTVYRARHTRLDRQVALKLLPARRLRDNAAVAKFEREMKAIGRLDHPTIVRATDAGDVDGTHFLAMDYVEGIDLSKLVRLVGPLDVASACEIVRQAALGLDYAHQQELIHRDVKPSNLMLTLRGEVRILDLGLALFGAASEALDELTTVGQLMGTLDYMAPEQGDNSHDVDARADVYSLGTTLFKLLTGTAPYDSPDCRTPLAKMKALATIDAPSVAERRSELPAELVSLVDQCLARNVEDRFTSAKGLADSLLPFCEGHVLTDLAECGRDLAMREDEKIPQPPTLPPFVQRLDSLAAETRINQRADSNGSRAGIARKLATWASVPLIFLAGIVIWIQTDNGTLVVECPKENIPIEIRTGGKFHSKETLSLGENELTIRSGTYEIVLPKDYESLTVENNVFTLKRGGEWIARVSKKSSTTQSGLPGIPGGVPGFGSGFPGAIASQATTPQGAINGAGISVPPGMTALQPGSAGPGITQRARPTRTLVFSGKTFEEWQQAVLTERNPAELENAVQALCILGRNNRDHEAATVVLKVVDGYPCEPLATVGEGKLVASAIRYLRSLKAETIIPAIADALRNGGPNVRQLIITYLTSDVTYAHFNNPDLPDIGVSSGLSDALADSEVFHNAIIDSFENLEAVIRKDAYKIVISRLDKELPDAKLWKFLEECSFAGFGDGTSINAARRLAETRPSPKLAAVFLNRLENVGLSLEEISQQRQNQIGEVTTDWWTSESNAWLGLAALGAQAAGHTDRIAKLVDNVPKSMSKPQVIYLMASPFLVKTRFEVHRQLLPIEILAMIGDGAKPAVPTINNVLQTLTGHAPKYRSRE